ncbi:MAG: monovalent cation/H+ antiporter complex subunit F [Verrucomicrobiota bacterium]
MISQELVHPWALNTGYVFIGMAILLSTWRLFRGPSVFDRIIALDLIAALVLCIAGLVVLETGRTLFLDVAMVVAVATFLGTIAFAKHLEQEGNLE